MNAECSSSTDPPQTPSQGFADVLLEAWDPEVPTRAAALRELTRMVRHKRPEALQAQEELLNVSSALGFFMFRKQVQQVSPTSVAFFP